jgi:hypothetical protein
MKDAVFILWLEGVNPENLTTLPSLSRLISNGVDIQLKPLPLVEKSVCYYQTLTGMGSGKFGRFDAVYPQDYKAHRDMGIPEGSLGRLLPDILRSRKVAVTFLEAKHKSELDALADQAYDCALVRFLHAGNASADEIDAIVQRCVELTMPETHLLILTDAWSPASHKLVNVNDFLADVGLLEVGTARNRAEINWTETLAYALGTGQVWINLRGREPQGIVGSGREYQEVCNALIHELGTNWLDPQTNEPIVERVLRKEEAYTGDYLFKAPDLIVVYRPGYSASPKAIELDFDGVSVHEDSAPLRMVAPYARLIASGPALTNGHIETGALVDVVPSVLYLLGRSIPMQLDGNVISSIFTQAYRQQTPVQQMENEDDLLSDEEEGMIVDRLRDLGYLG